MKDDAELRMSWRRHSLAPNHEWMLIPYTFVYITLLTIAVMITPRTSGGFERFVDFAIIIPFWCWAIYAVFLNEKRFWLIGPRSVIDRPYEDRALEKCVRLWSTLIPAQLAVAAVLESSATSDRIFRLHENERFLALGRRLDDALAFVPVDAWFVFLLDAADRAAILIIATFFLFFGASYFMRSTGHTYLVGGLALGLATLSLLFFWVSILFMGPPIH